MGNQVSGNGNYRHCHGNAHSRGNILLIAANGHLLMFCIINNSELLKLTFLAVIITDDDYLKNILQLLVY